MSIKNETSRITRRNFVGLVGAAGLGAASAAVFGAAANPDREVVQGIPTVISAAPEEPTTDHSGHNATGDATPTTGGDSVDEMDAMHEQGILDFPAPTEGLGGQPLEYELDGDVKVFRLTCDVVRWEYAPGQYSDGYAYNGVIPGPEIRVNEGDTVRVHVTNNLPESTVIHWHGLIVPHSQDGVTFVTQPPIKPGGEFTYEFTLREGNTGSHMYHSHHNAAEQVTKGLLGAFIVEPNDPNKYGEFDREYTIILNDGPIGGFTLNGKGFPATQPVMAKKGEKVLIRYMNEGLMIHPMHLVSDAAACRRRMVGRFRNRTSATHGQRPRPASAAMSSSMRLKSVPGRSTRQHPVAR
ncbi:MAG: multicopper oxidase domain-containing protein [Thermomicrobiales bacterium]|nr:multicopper oxidase domain-containing protein [Thermomicrobiales bacterium]